jgi:NhaP-type Na+/H+ or K+/H+ antiporter
VRIPAAVLLVAVGATFGSIRHVKPPFEFGPTLFFVFLPPLVFEAAWSIDLTALHACMVRVGLLALPGTVVSAQVEAAIVVASGALVVSGILAAVGLTELDSSGRSPEGNSRQRLAV